VAEMRTILRWIFIIYFDGNIPDLTVRWDECNPELLGYASSYPEAEVKNFPRITVNSDLKRAQQMAAFGDYFLLETLCTLIHEAVHVYIEHWACCHCESYAKNNGGDGHGRAWQLLAKKIEESISELLDLPIHLDRSDSLINHLRDGQNPPSRHDLSTYGFREWRMFGNFECRKSHG
jgi:hypothetical protein